MNRALRVGAGFAALLLTGAASRPSVLLGQAVTTAAIYGTVSGSDSVGLAGATVTVTNTATGERWQVETRPRGRYVLEYLSLGGPYSVEARAIGSAPDTAGGVHLSLGERQRVDFRLVPVAVALPEIAVVGVADPWINPGRTGPSQTIGDTLASRLPLRGRDFTQLTFLSPQATLTADQGASIAGQFDRLNGLQIDGATYADLAGMSGLFGFGTPGSAAGVKTLSPEALRELQILSAPFDVRYGTFAGGLVNAVTKSGSNHWEGTISGYFEDELLAGHDAAGHLPADFGRADLALTLGGPIVRDRAAFFVDLGLQRFSTPADSGINPAIQCGEDDAPGICAGSAARMQEILRNRYGVDAGSAIPTSNGQRSGNIFAKITLQPMLNHRLEVSHNYARGTPHFESAGFNGFGAAGPAYLLSSAGADYPSSVNGTRLAWTFAGNGHGNELTLARFQVRESCRPASGFPQLVVNVSPDPVDSNGQPAPRFESASDHLVAGAVEGCEGRFADQDVWELTDNFSWYLGRHQLTIGTHEELIHIRGQDEDSSGFWRFGSLDSLDQGQPYRYARTVAGPLRSDGPVGDFRVRQLGFYLQDHWSVTPSLTLTPGLRMDLPLLPDQPVRNPAVASELGVDTDEAPGGDPLFSPRLGFSYQVGPGRNTFVRGGIGMFVGRPVYQFVKNVYQSTGQELLLLCRAGSVPAFSIDPNAQPTACDPPGSAAPDVTYFAPSFRFPRNLRVALGVDTRLSQGTVATVDLLFIRATSQFDIIDANLSGPAGELGGEGSRVLYGSPATGAPNRRSDSFGPVYEIRNASGDRSFSGTLQLQHRLRNGAELSLAYTYTDSRDRMTPNLPFAAGNVGFVPLDGTFENRSLAPFVFGGAQKITAVAAVNLPLDLRFALFYNRYAGHRYAYVVDGDANADGISGNDLVYVPRDVSDITMAFAGEYDSLEARIGRDRCLRRFRGRIMHRNSCTEPWVTLLNARASKVFPTVSGHSLELIADLFNVLSFLDRDWGRQHRVNAVSVPLLGLVGYDEAADRGVYTLIPGETVVEDTEASRWRMQLGARYSF